MVYTSLRSEIAPLPRFESAITDLSVVGIKGGGEHIDYRPVTGDVDLPIDNVEFDPSLHDVGDIDFTDEDGLADGGLYVPIGFMNRPLTVNIVRDHMPRAEVMPITGRKREVASLIARSLQACIPQTDPVNGIVVDQYARREFAFDDAVVAAESRQDGARVISGIALDGLSIAIGDFNAMRFEPKSMENTVAIKVNHVLERDVPARIGTVHVGNGIELNTNKSRDLRRYNERVQREHDETVRGLESAGAQVVSVVVDPRIKPVGFDPNVMDASLAQAVEILGR